MALFTAGQVLTAAQLNALFGLGATKKITATGNVTSSDLPTGQMVLILGWSGGGGSGGCAATTAATNVAAASGGSSGAFGLAVVKYSLITFPFAVTIGSAGAAATAGNNSGGSGGNTTVIDNNGAGATYLSLVGGQGGGGSAASATNYQLLSVSGAGGAVTIATFGIAGEVGAPGYSLVGTTAAMAGGGAAAPWGGGQVVNVIGNGTQRSPLPGIIPGGGAAGGSNTGTQGALAGAAGARGEVWFVVI